MTNNDLDSLNRNSPFDDKRCFGGAQLTSNEIKSVAMQSLSKELDNCSIEKQLEWKFNSLKQIGSLIKTYQYPFLKQGLLIKLATLKEDINYIVVDSKDEAKYATKVWYLELLNQSLLSLNIGDNLDKLYQNMSTMFMEFIKLLNKNAFTNSEALQYFFIFASYFLDSNRIENLGTLANKFSTYNFENLTQADEFSHQLLQAIFYWNKKEFDKQLAIQSQMKVEHAPSLTQLADYYHYYHSALATKLNTANDDQIILKAVDTGFLSASTLYKANIYNHEKMEVGLFNSVNIYGQIASQDSSYKQKLYDAVELVIAVDGAKKWLHAKSKLSNDALSYVKKYVQNLNSEEHPNLPKSDDRIEAIFNLEDSQGTNNLITSILNKDSAQVLVYLTILDDLYPGLPCQTKANLYLKLANGFAKFSAFALESSSVILHFASKVPDLDSCPLAKPAFTTSEQHYKLIHDLKCVAYKGISLWDAQDIMTTTGHKFYFEQAVEEMDLVCDQALYSTTEASLNG